MAISEQHERRRELASTSDPRASRTRDRIVAALGELLASGEVPSVAAICERAGAGRSTFYTHFATVTDVIVYVVDGMFDELGRRDATRRGDQSIPRAVITSIGMREIFDLLVERRLFFGYAASAPAAERLRERLVEEFSRGAHQTILVERPEASAEFVRTAGEYLANGLLGIMLGWLSDPRGRSEQEVIEIAIDLMPPWLASGADS